MLKRIVWMEVLETIAETVWIAAILYIFVRDALSEDEKTSVPTAQLPTVFTTLGAIGTGTFGIASLLMGILADAFGIRGVFLFSGMLLAEVSLIAYKGKILLWRTVEELKNRKETFGVNSNVSLLFIRPLVRRDLFAWN